MYSTTNEEITGFRVGRKTTAGTLCHKHENAVRLQDGIFFKRPDAETATSQSVKTKIDKQQAFNWFNEFSQIIGGMNTIIGNTPASPAPEGNDDPENRNWIVFLGISVIIILFLTAYFFIIKK